MKCGNCDNFTFGKCVDDKCYGGCEIDSKNRTVHTEQECIVEAEDLKCFEIDSGEREWVIARSREEATAYYKELTQYEHEELEIKGLTEWHNILLKVEGSTVGGWEELTFLEFVKIDYNPATFVPYIIATTCW